MFLQLVVRKLTKYYYCMHVHCLWQKTEAIPVFDCICTAVNQLENMAKPEEMYTQTKARTLATLKSNHTKKNHLGSLHPPLLNIQLDHVVMQARTQDCKRGGS